VSGQDSGASFAFQGLVHHWRGPAPYYFVRVPPETAEELADVAAEVTYGWGMVPVEVTVGGYTWETSLWPKDGSYLLPIRAQVRRALEIEVDHLVAVRLTIAPRADRPIDPSTGSPRRSGVRKLGDE
jgi:hypothetical protein